MVGKSADPHRTRRMPHPRKGFHYGTNEISHCSYCTCHKDGPKREHSDRQCSMERHFFATSSNFPPAMLFISERTIACDGNAKQWSVLGSLKLRRIGK